MRQCSRESVEQFGARDHLPEDRFGEVRLRHVDRIGVFAVVRDQRRLVAFAVVVARAKQQRQERLTLHERGFRSAGLVVGRRRFCRIVIALRAISADNSGFVLGARYGEVVRFEGITHAEAGGQDCREAFQACGIGERLFEVLTREAILGRAHAIAAPGLGVRFVPEAVSLAEHRHRHVAAAQEVGFLAGSAIRQQAAQPRARVDRGLRGVENRVGLHQHRFDHRALREGDDALDCGQWHEHRVVGRVGVGLGQGLVPDGADGLGQDVNDVLEQHPGRLAGLGVVAGRSDPVDPALQRGNQFRGGRLRRANGRLRLGLCAGFFEDGVHACTSSVVSDSYARRASFSTVQ
ncbi:hypothetical protein D3C87_1346540 [compost metagenome]